MRPHVDEHVLVDLCNNKHNTTTTAAALIISVWHDKEGNESYTARLLPAQVRRIEKNLCGIRSCHCQKIATEVWLPAFNVPGEIIQRSGLGQPMLILWHVSPEVAL